MDRSWFLSQFVNWPSAQTLKMHEYSHEATFLRILLMRISVRSNDENVIDTLGNDHLSGINPACNLEIWHSHKCLIA